MDAHIRSVDICRVGGLPLEIENQIPIILVNDVDMRRVRDRQVCIRI